MTIVHVFAHFDDEFCAWPLIRQAIAEGREQRFVHVVDYRTPGLSARRRGETLRFLRAHGFGPESEIHLGAGTGWLDGHLHRHAGPAYEALKAAIPGPVERIVCPAWEGGHPDHDVCAALAVKLAAERGGGPVEQVALYQGKDMPWILYRAATPLPENGPATAIRLGAAEWAHWLAQARHFPSQLGVLAVLVPAMVASCVPRGDFRYQRLDPKRIGERPHEGPLHYERLFKAPYRDVRAGVDSLTLDGKAPWTPVDSASRRAGPA